MKKVLVAYFSSSGKTEEMANYIAEGVRFNGLQAKVMKVSEIKNVDDIAGYDGYIIGSPTFSLDIPAPVKLFLEELKKVNLAEKLGGAFGPYLHDASYQHAEHAPAIILNELQNEIKLKPFDLEALALQEDILGTREGIKACQDYGRVFGQRLAGKG
ncbi:MAG: flavodoxin domain-containing protein [Dehalococcoidales bacterium]